MAVIAPAGVVGRVVVPSASAAKVQLLVDRNAAAGAVIERREIARAGRRASGPATVSFAWNTSRKSPTSSSATSS